MADYQAKWSHIRDYIDAANGSEEAFVLRHNHPFLVLVGPSNCNDHVGDEYFTTHHCENGARVHSDFSDGEIVNPLSIVFPVIKRPGVNPYAGMITIGRADNCDIVVPSPGVSKFHCFIRTVVGQSTQYFLSDGGSRNGTRLNEKRIAEKEQLEIKPGDHIILGAKVTLCFFLVRDFQNILRKTLKL